MKQKDQVQESIQEYMTIFNMYKQFHRKQESSPEKSEEKTGALSQSGKKEPPEKSSHERDESKEAHGGKDMSDEDLDTLCQLIVAS